MEPKQVIVIRTDTEPKMRKGKMIAQACHASLAVLLDAFFGEYNNRDWDAEEEDNVCKEVHLWKDDAIYQWINNSFVKIVCKGNIGDVVNTYTKAKKAGIPCSLIEDKGLTEFKGKVTITCCAIGPATAEEIDPITGHLDLL